MGRYGYGDVEYIDTGGYQVFAIMLISLGFQLNNLLCYPASYIVT